MIATNAEEFIRDPAEEACYDIQTACWQFEKAIKDCISSGRLAFLDGMIAESRKRVELLAVTLAARQTELER